MEKLVFADLTIEVEPSASGEPIQLVWRGKSNDRQPGKVLDPYLAAALSEASAEGRALEMRFSALEHFNSSTLTAIIGAVQKARHLRVPLTIVFDRSIKWQKLGFDALRVLSKGDGLLDIRGV